MGVLKANVNGEWVEVPSGGVGTPSGSDTFTYVQASPAAVWTIAHTLDYQPNVTVIDSAHEQVEGDVIYGPIGSISIIFSGAFSGTAYLS